MKQEASRIRAIRSRNFAFAIFDLSKFPILTCRQSYMCYTLETHNITGELYLEGFVVYHKATRVDSISKDFPRGSLFKECLTIPASSFGRISICRQERSIAEFGFPPPSLKERYGYYTMICRRFHIPDLVPNTKTIVPKKTTFIRMEKLCNLTQK